jgi:hypothetical protein
MIFSFKIISHFVMVLLFHFCLVYILLYLNVVSNLFTVINLSFFLVFVSLFLLYALKRIKQLLFLLVVVFSLVSYNIVSFTLLNTDRSRSFFVLSWVQNGNIDLNNQKLIVKNPVSLEFQNPDSVIQRIIEQRENGLIEKTSLKLTKPGKFFLSCIEFMASIFDLQGWYENT